LELTTPQIYVFIILIVAFGLLVTERLRIDLIACLIILGLAGTGVLTSEQAFSGFGSEPAIVVAAIFIKTAAMDQTGVAEVMGHWIGRLAGSSYTRIIAVIMSSVALLSAFTHHVTTTAVMLPVTRRLAEDRNIPPSKLLMPLSFAASLGTTITIIGAPAFLVASGALQASGRPGLAIFSIAPIGLALSAAGTLFMVLLGRFLLPDRGRGTDDEDDQFKLSDYFTEVKILDDSPLVGKRVEDLPEERKSQFDVVGWVRGGHPLRVQRGTLKAGDVLLVRTSPDQLATVREEPGVELHPVEQYGGNGSSPSSDGDGDEIGKPVQAVVAQGADIAGRTIAEVDFRRRYGAIVLGLWRQEGRLKQELSSVRLRPGDVLVLQGDDEALARIRNDRSFLMMVPFHGEPRMRRKGPLTAALMLATVLLATFGWTTLIVASLFGAAAMVLTGCISPRRAYQAIDARIYVFIAGAIPLGTAMQQTKASDILANWIQGAIGGWSETLILLLLFAVIALLTQFMSDAATTGLFAPVAIPLAQGLGHAPEAYVVTVAMASVVAFLTPIGHHGNLLVYGPGRYQFADFTRVGAPLTVVCAIIVALMAPMVWPT
jgi:di/tricarboxylate transporter